jgi:Bacterial archaeo-eukaryotic release factor family 2
VIVMDLQFLRPLYEHFGGYVSVYLDTSRDSEDATGALDLRWRSARERLASAGADHPTLDALAGVITDASRGAPGRAAFGHGGQVVLTEALPHPPRREIARLAALPHVMPLLAQRRPHVPYLRVMARHDGGEIASVTAAGTQDDEKVTGTGRPVHKVKSGGSSQLRYAHHTEDAWETNAKELAGRVTAEAREVGAALIVVAGDPVARTLLVRELGSDLAAVTVTIDAEVGADSDEVARAADEAVAQHAAQRSQERFEHWRTQLSHDRGVQGLAAAMTALRDGGAAELLLADHPESAASAWIGPGGIELAATAGELTGRGVQDPVQDRADAALARGLSASDAQLYFLPGDLPASAGAPQDGVGAVLRLPREAVT